MAASPPPSAPSDSGVSPAPPRSLVERRRRYVAAAGLWFALLLLASGRTLVHPPPALPAITPVEQAPIVPAPRAVKKPAGKNKKKTKTIAAAARTPAPVRRSTPKPRAPAVAVSPKEFRVRDVRVEDAAYRVTIRGAVWLDRRGVIAQPRLRYVLRDRDGVVTRTGEFTPADAAGPLWIGFGYDGLKAVPFTLDLDLRGSTPGRAPRAPLSATVTPVAVVDAKLR